MIDYNSKRDLTTSGLIKRAYGAHNVFRLSEDDIKYLFNYFTPEQYTKGIYGVNAKIYPVCYGPQRFVITVGRKPFGVIDDKFIAITRRYNHLAEMLSKDEKRLARLHDGRDPNGYKYLGFKMSLYCRWADEIRRAGFGKPLTE